MHLRVILRNIFSTWSSYLVTLLVGFLMAPFVVHHLGNTGYGIWTLVLSLTGYFGMLDLGVRQSVGRFVARHVALGDHREANRTISTALVMLAVGGGLALLASLVASRNVGAFKIDPALASAASLVVCIAGLNISFALPMGVFGAVLASLDRFDVMTVVVICGALTRAGLTLFLLTHGHGLIALALVTLFTGAAEYTAMAVMAKLLYPPLHISWKNVELAKCRELFGFGIYRFLWIVSNQVIFYTDSVVLGVFLNVATITYYAIAGSLVNYGRNVVSLAMETLCPTASRLDAKNDIRGLQDLLLLGTRVSLLIGLPMCMGFMFLGKQFITLWMGSAYAAIGAGVLIVLTIPQFTSMSSQYISSLILVGMARHKSLAYVAGAEAAANLVLSIILVRKIGLIGVAWGTAIPHLITTGLVVPWYTLRQVQMSPADYIVRGFARPALCAIPAAAICYMFSLLKTPVTWLLFGGEVITIAVVFGALAYLICLSRDQQRALRTRLRLSGAKEAAVQQA